MKYMDDRVDETMHHFRYDQGYDYESDLFIGELLNGDDPEPSDSRA